MKWKAWSVVLAMILIIMSVVAPTIAAQAPQPGDNPPADRPQKPSPEQRLLNTLRQANRMRGAVRGKISAIGTSEIEVTFGPEDDRQVRILAVNDETVYRVPEIDEATLDDLSIDDLVVVTPSREDTDLAKSVGVVTGRQMREINAGQRLLQGVQKLLGNNSRRGEVTAITEKSVTIATPQGDVELILSEETRFVGLEGIEISVDDLAVGDAITVIGQVDPTTPINARTIKVMPAKAEE